MFIQQILLIQTDKIFSRVFILEVSLYILKFMKVVVQNVLYYNNKYLVSTPRRTSSTVYSVKSVDYVNQ